MDDTDNWAWEVVRNTEYKRILTNTEKEQSAGFVTVRIYIIAIDQFGNESETTATATLESGKSVIKAGTLGGFTLSDSGFATSDGIVGMSSLVTGGVDWRFWAGNADPGSAPFRVDENGNLYATSATITGSITATSGVIGGFTVDSTEGLYAGTGATRVQMKAGAGIWTGATAIGDAPFSVTNAGVLKAESGTIGGCILAASSIESSNFVTGSLGSGWKISDTGETELQNAFIRGKLSVTVFEKDTVNIVNGILLITKGDVLDADMTALGTTLTISGDCTFAVNEILRIKDGVNDEWLQVTNIDSAPTYTVTRDLASSYPANKPIWKIGIPVASFSTTSEGFIELDGSSSDSPVLTIYKRNSVTYSDYTSVLKLGKLDGFIGIPASSYGIAIGDGSNYLKYYAALGLQVKGNIDASTITSSDITGGTIVGTTFYTSLTGQRFELNSAGMTMYMSGDLELWDGTGLWDGTSQWGPNIRAYLYNTGKNVPLYFNAASNNADVHYYNRIADPTGTNEIGDTCVVDGELKICTVAGTPGTWTVVGTQS